MRGSTSRIKSLLVRPLRSEERCRGYFRSLAGLFPSADAPPSDCALGGRALSDCCPPFKHDLALMSPADTTFPAKCGDHRLLFFTAA